MDQKNIQMMKRSIIALCIFLPILFFGCSFQKNMTFKQNFLRWVYPAISYGSRLTNKNAESMIKDTLIDPPVSVYDIPVVLNDGSNITLAQFKGKKILIVNTASDCGYTGQYEGLQKLHTQVKDKLVIIGFPANNFKEQEKGSDEEIATFCKKNYGVEFLLAQKSDVIRGNTQHPIFNWLTDPAKNGWNEKEPGWNFSKYLISENGQLMGYFGSAIEPETITELVK